MDAKTQMSNMQTYKIWAPDNDLWTEWAKPVLFVSFPNWETSPDDAIEEIPQISWLPEKCYYSMIVVDLPGKQSVVEGLGLAQSGYRPVPLYNGVVAPNKSSTPSTSEIAAAMFAGAETLRALAIVSTAPPAFLLDSNRMTGTGRIPGQFDNRWCIFPQDMPSAVFLLKRSIREIIVRSDCIRDDLAHVLLRYQEQGINISLCNGSEIKLVTVPKPSQFKSLFYRFKIILGLTRNPTGGFGGLIPLRSSGG